MAKATPKVDMPQIYTIRKGFVLHKERLDSKGRTITDSYDGDDLDNNLVELSAAELPKYLHQLELPAEEPPEPSEL
jgi:hypothetical protein